MMRSAAALLILAALPGCSLLFPEDPRVGEEGQNACLTRVQGEIRLELASVGDDPEAIFVPTYTYDITKLGLEAIQELSKSRFDETQGSRLIRESTSTATAVDTFMSQSVDEEGAFFMTTDPALYRVRGEAAPLADIIAQGCERQQANMRLIDVDFAPSSPAECVPEDGDASTPNAECTPENETN